MPGLVPGIHVLYSIEAKEDVDGRVKPGHDEELRSQTSRPSNSSVTSSENRFRTPATITHSGSSAIAVAPGMP